MENRIFELRIDGETELVSGMAAMVIMQNDDTFFIDPSEQKELLSYFKILNA